MPEIRNNVGGPVEAGNYPVVDVTYEEGMGGQLITEPNQILIRTDDKFGFFYPTDPDVAPVEWSVRMDLVVTMRLRAIVSFDRGELEN